MRGMKNTFRPDDNATLLNTSVLAPTNLTFCKAMNETNVCCTWAGFEAIKAKWLAAKTKMKDARDAKLKLYND